MKAVAKISISVKNVNFISESYMYMYSQVQGCESDYEK